MKKSRFTEAPIVAALKEGEAGVPVAQLVRKHGISSATYYTWRSKYAGVSVSDLKRLRELEAENSKLKRMYADLILDERSDQGRVVPKTVTPSAKRPVAEALVKDHRLPIRRACQIVRLSRAAYYRTPPASMERDREVIEALNQLGASNGRWGFWKCYDRLRLDGHRWNHQRVHRVYCELRLNLPRRTQRRIPQRLRQPLAAPATLNGTWALDFMHDTLYGGRRFRTLNVIDEGNREGLAIEIETSIPSARVVRVMEQLIDLHGRPSPASPIRMPSASASTAATARKCSASSSRSSRSAC